MPSRGIYVRLDTRRLDQLGREARQRAEAILDKTARDVEAGWKDEIVAKDVIDTGAYLNSVHVEPSHPPLQRTVADAVEYGVYQEFGTRLMPARPCLTPAVERVRRGLVEAWRALFK